LVYIQLKRKLLTVKTPQKCQFSLVGFGSGYVFKRQLVDIQLVDVF